MEATIYLVEDEKNLNQLLGKYLELEGHKVTSFLDGLSAMAKIEDKPDLWILDIMLPDLDGYQLIKAIKAVDPEIPVIFISARNEELDRVVGLELGSDDYLPKPFLPRELVIRCNRLLARTKRGIRDAAASEHECLECYELDRKSRTFSLGHQEIPLTVKEYELLLYFLENRNAVVTRDQILNNVWGMDYFGSDRVVDDTVRRIRKKAPELNLETLYGYGYKLVVKG